MQFNAGEWSVDKFDFALNDMTLYMAPDKDYRVLYMLGERGLAVDFATKRRETIIEQRSPLRRDHRLGFLYKIRQIGERLYASGGGGQVHRREADGTCSILDPALLDGLSRGTEILREFRKIANPTPADYEALRVKGMADMSNILWGLGGLAEDDIYVCGDTSRIFHYDGTRFSEVPIRPPEDRSLLYVLPETPDRVWVCGRKGALLLGNARDGFHEAPGLAALGNDRPSFNGMAFFEGKLYLSSYSGPCGLFVHDRRTIERVWSGLEPDIEDVSAVDAADGVLWVMGTKDLLRFDGQRWERFDLPGNDPVR